MATEASVLIVIGEPEEESHVALILDRVREGFTLWDSESYKTDLNTELLNFINSDIPPEETDGNGLVLRCDGRIYIEILIEPSVNLLHQALQNFLLIPCPYKLIIHSGPIYQWSGSWILRDGTFSFHDLARFFYRGEMSNILNNNAIDQDAVINISCITEGEWCEHGLKTHDIGKRFGLSVRQAGSYHAPTCTNDFGAYLRRYVVYRPLDSLTPASKMVGSLKFRRPTAYLFPGGQGDALLLGVNGFLTLIDGGAQRQPCYWSFLSHVDRIDVALLTGVTPASSRGAWSLTQRLADAAFNDDATAGGGDSFSPKIGYFMTNTPAKPHVSQTDQPRHPLIISSIEKARQYTENVRRLGLEAQPLFSTFNSATKLPEAQTLYQKVGVGRLEMYVLNPTKDSKELADFCNSWKKLSSALNTSNSHFSLKPGSNGVFTIPLHKQCSAALLLVWMPAQPNEPIVRVLYPGSCPQEKIMQGMERLKHLEFLRLHHCTPAMLAAVGSSVKKGQVVGPASQAISRKSLEISTLKAKPAPPPTVLSKMEEGGLRQGVTDSVAAKAAFFSKPNSPNDADLSKLAENNNISSIEINREPQVDLFKKNAQETIDAPFSNEEIAAIIADDGFDAEVRASKTDIIPETPPAMISSSETKRAADEYRENAQKSVASGSSFGAISVESSKISAAAFSQDGSEADADTTMLNYSLSSPTNQNAVSSPTNQNAANVESDQSAVNDVISSPSPMHGRTVFGATSDKPETVMGSMDYADSGEPIISSGPSPDQIDENKPNLSVADKRHTNDVEITTNENLVSLVEKLDTVSLTETDAEGYGIGGYAQRPAMNLGFVGGPLQPDTNSSSSAAISPVSPAPAVSEAVADASASPQSNSISMPSPTSPTKTSQIAAILNPDAPAFVPRRLSSSEVSTSPEAISDGSPSDAQHSSPHHLIDNPFELGAARLEKFASAATPLDKFSSAATLLDTLTSAAAPLDEFSAVATPLDKLSSEVTPLGTLRSAAAPLGEFTAAASPLDKVSSAATPLDNYESAATPLDKFSSLAEPVDQSALAATPLDEFASAARPLNKFGGSDSRTDRESKPFADADPKSPGANASSRVKTVEELMKEWGEPLGLPPIQPQPSKIDSANKTTLGGSPTDTSRTIKNGSTKSNVSTTGSKGYSAATAKKEAQPASSYVFKAKPAPKRNSAALSTSANQGEKTTAMKVAASATSKPEPPAILATTKSGRSALANGESRAAAAKTSAPKRPASSGSKLTKATPEGVGSKPTEDGKRPEKPVALKASASKKEPAAFRKPITHGLVSKTAIGKKTSAVGGASGAAYFVDLTFLPHQANPNYCNAEQFFRLIRSRFYALSGCQTSKETLDAALTAKHQWNAADSTMTLLPAYDGEALALWMALRRDDLARDGVEVAPSCARCTLNLEEGGGAVGAAYRLEL